MKKTDLLSLIQQRRVPHALLFSGGQLSDKREFAFHVAKLLLGEKWMEDYSHPDFLYLETTTIDDVREVTAKLYQTAHQGNYKVVIFGLAESMPMGAMNALLKTLEEPPQHSILILITEFPSLLPLTLRSRCQNVLFNEKKMIGIDSALSASLRKNLNPSEVAAQYEKQPLSETLEKLYFIAVDLILKKSSHNPRLFLWLDEINRSREKVMRKYNPNVLLTLENLFARWVSYGLD